MNDRHKYRFWDEEDKKYYYYDTLTSIRRPYTENSTFPQYESSPRYHKGIFEQCTGLSAAKSYRGEKPEDLLIWEGDVLKLYRSCPDAKYTIIRNVYYDSDEAGFYVKDYPERPMGTSIIHPAKKEWCERAEIIGTIHEVGK